MDRDGIFRFVRIVILILLCLGGLYLVGSSLINQLQGNSQPVAEPTRLYTEAEVQATLAAHDGRAEEDLTAPTISGEVFAVDEEEQAELYVGHGEYVQVDFEAYRNPAGYLIPRDQLRRMSDFGYLLFEGEQREEGIHDILSIVFPDGEFAPQVGDEGLQLRDEGSFWRYEANDGPRSGFDRVDDLLMVFAQNKRDNWLVQGMPGTTIQVWLSTGMVSFENNEEVTLSNEQRDLVEANDADRCPSGDEPLEENPLGDPQSYDLRIGQFGSSSCITLLVRGESAVWFDGPRDGVRYRPSETRVFLVPLDWDENDMRQFLKLEGINFSAIGELLSN